MPCHLRRHLHFASRPLSKQPLIGLRGIIRYYLLDSSLIGLVAFDAHDPQHRIILGIFSTSAALLMRSALGYTTRIRNSTSRSRIASGIPATVRQSHSQFCFCPGKAALPPVLGLQFHQELDCLGSIHPFFLKRKQTRADNAHQQLPHQRCTSLFCLPKSWHTQPPPHNCRVGPRLALPQDCKKVSVSLGRPVASKVGESASL